MREQSKTQSAEHARVSRIMRMSDSMLAMTGNVDERASLDASEAMHAELAYLALGDALGNGDAS
jgi:hypothetical protein